MIKYDWKMGLELFFALGAAVVVAFAQVVRDTGFGQDPTDFDTFQEWATWLSIAAAACGRAAWLAFVAVIGKLVMRGLPSDEE